MFKNMSVEENLRNLGARIGSQTAEVERQRRAYIDIPYN